MPFVVTSEDAFATGVAQSVSAWGEDPESDWQKYVATISAMFEDPWDLAAPRGTLAGGNYAPGWSGLLDVELCPTKFLPYLSMFNGTGVQPEADDASARAAIKDEAGMKRGTPSALTAAAKRNLIDTQFLVMRERTAFDGSVDPYHLLIGYRPEECPDRSLLITAVEAIKPAGLQIDYIASDAWTWDEAIRVWQLDTMTWHAAQTVQP